MNALAQELLTVCKKYLGPAAPAFVHRELKEIGTDANRIEPRQLESFAEAAMLRSEPLMGPVKAAELRTALLKCASETASAPTGEHKLASAAASRLLERGKTTEAVAAYRELAEKDGDVHSYRGLASALATSGDRDGAVRALRDAAATRLRANDRGGELQLLADAVVLAPLDLSTHRRLAAALANHGDLAGACFEYGRYIDAVLAQGDDRRAWLELAYARELLGELPDLLAIVDRLAARSAPGPRTAVDEARPATPARPASGAQSVPTPAPSTPPVSNEPIDFQKAALRRRFREREHTVPATPAPRVQSPPVHLPPPPDIEATLATLVPRGVTLEAAAIAHMRATVLIGARDPRARDAVIDAAQRLLVLDRPRSAADVLLAYVNSGSEARDAHLLLCEAIRRLGRSDIAEEKRVLVATLERLDARPAARASLPA